MRFRAEISEFQNRIYLEKAENIGFAIKLDELNAAKF